MKMMFCVLLQLAALCIGLQVAKTSGSGAAYCRESQALETKYLVPFYESHVAVTGCASRQRSSSGSQVHSLRIDTAASDVMLTYNEIESGSGGVVLLLHSARPVRWRLTFMGFSPPSYKRVVYLSAESSVLSTNSAVSTVSMEQLNLLNDSLPDVDYAQRVQQRFGALTTFSRIQGANRISISMVNKEALPAKCLLLNQARRHSSSKAPWPDSASATLGNSLFAYLVKRQNMSGCFHAQVSGMSDSDVHVFDLKSADPFASSQPDEVPPYVPVVYLSISPDQHGIDPHDMMMNRNLTLVLKSSVPVKWSLESWGISGRLLVISNFGHVDNYSLAPTQTLHSIHKAFPDTFESLWKMVMADTGVTPVSFIKLDLANVLSLSIPPKSKQGLAQVLAAMDDDGSARLVPDADQNRFLHDKQSEENLDLAEKTIIIPGKMFQLHDTDHGLFHELEANFSAGMIKRCTDSQTIEVIVALALTQQYSISNLTWNEKYCQGTHNDTHWILSTKSTSCGSVTSFAEDSPVVRNNVHLYFTPNSSLEGVDIEIPVSCRFNAGFPALSSHHDDQGDKTAGGYPEDKEEEEEPDDSEDEHSLSNEMYHMRVFKLPRTLVLEHRVDSSTVLVGDRLRIETHFDARLGFNLALERCWLSDSPDSHSRQLKSEDQWLIWQGCPTQADVQVFSSPHHFPSFEFNVSKKHHKMNVLYIFCLIGLCSSSKDYSGGNLAKCQNMSEECDGSGNVAAVRVSPTAQQVSLRGPLYVLDPDDYLNGSGQTSASLWPLSPASTTADSSGKTWPNRRQLDADYADEEFMIVGVSLEIAIAISVASFLIGAVLTGTLCCLHQKRSLLRIKSTSGPGRGAAVVAAESADGSELQPMMGQLSNGPSSSSAGEASPNDTGPQLA